jgi:hypothetical protein
MTMLPLPCQRLTETCPAPVWIYSPPTQPSYHPNINKPIFSKQRNPVNTSQQRKDKTLLGVLSKHAKLFNGTLGRYPREKIHLEVDPKAIPHRSRAYPIPHTHLRLFQDELERLVSIGVLEPQGRAEWISGSFLIPKKDSTVRWISDFRALNKAIKRKVYPIPRIQDILSRRAGYAFLSKLDISMQYYTFELDEASKDLCPIDAPFGLYRYCRLPMGICQSPDIAQEVMERVLHGIKDTEVYIDDIACFSNSFTSHLALLDQVLHRLEQNGFTINPRKCEWAVQETDFLGHWLTPTGIKPWPKKVQAILHLQPPANLKQLRTFSWVGILVPRYVTSSFSHSCPSYRPSQNPQTLSVDENPSNRIRTDEIFNHPGHSLSLS